MAGEGGKKEESQEIINGDEGQRVENEKGGKKDREGQKVRDRIARKGSRLFILPPLSLSCGVSVKTNNHNKLLAVRRNKFYRKSRRSDQIRSKERETNGEERCQSQTRPAALFLSHNFWR